MSDTVAPDIVDQVVLFGKSCRLVGILTEPGEAPSRPAENGARAQRPAVIILNAGIINRVGFNRMNPLWANRMARAGHAVLRFDMSGIGDSERRSEPMAPLDSAMADIREAIDWIGSARGINRIILIGLCAGADHALLYAGSDSRVAGVVLLDPLIPPTRRFLFNYIAGKLAKPRIWKQLPRLGAIILAAWRREQHRRQQPEDWAAGPVPYDGARARTILRRAYSTALALDVRILCLLTSGVDYQHNYRTQLFDAFPDIDFGDRLTLEYFVPCDHSFTSAANRARLFDVAGRWLDATDFKREPSAGGAASSQSDAEGFLSVEF